MTDATRQACIVGVGETPYTRWGRMGDRGEWSLACEAVLNAAADAGLEIEQIDGLASFSNDATVPWLMQHALGLPRLGFTSMVWGGGGSGACGAVAHAAAAVEAGQAQFVAVFRSLCQGPGHRYGQAGGFSGLPHLNFMAPFGMFSPPIMIAPLVQRYIHEFNAKPEHFGEVALVCRDNAQRNPRAVMRGRPLTMEDYLNSRIIASPLRLFDCCQENDGACALIVTTLERARDLRRKPVRILAAAQGGNPGWGDGALGSHNMPIAEYGAGNGKALAIRLFERAGVTPADVDTVQIYDHFTGLVLMTLENFGVLWTWRSWAVRCCRQYSLARWASPPQHFRRTSVGSLHSRVELGGGRRAATPGRIDVPSKRRRDLCSHRGRECLAVQRGDLRSLTMAYLPNEIPGPRPTVDDKAFWDYCQQRELRFQRCAACHRFRHPPTPVCPQCRSFESEWVRAPETGVVFSFTIVHHAAHPAVSAVTPYNIVIVDFPACGHTRLVSNLVDAMPEEIRIGMPVVLVWETVGNGRVVPRFKKSSD